MEEERHFRNYISVTYPHKLCFGHVESEDAVNILVVASELVKELLCTAEEFIGADIPEVFYYKFPKKMHRPSQGIVDKDEHSESSESDNSEKATQIRYDKQYFDYNDTFSIGDLSLNSITPKDETRHPDDIEWLTIERFNLRDCASQIRDFIELWKLMPSTKCALILKDNAELKANKGFRYQVDALFSNPTPKCPNPLAVATVHFYIHVPELMPKYYPVMITYRFEGFKSTYHALGTKQMRSLEFQRFFIDTILHTKLNFYAELFRCRFPHEGDLHHSIEDNIDDESLFDCEEVSSQDAEAEEDTLLENYEFLNETPDHLNY